MKQRPSKAARPDLLPWQGALMVVCVTAAGLFHEHPREIGPLLASRQTATFGTTQPVPMADLLNTALLMLR